MIPTLFGLPSPRLPARHPAVAWTPLTLAGALHLLALAVVVMMLPRTAQRTTDEPVAAPDVRVVLPPHILFLPGTAGTGGGGGGNRQPEPFRHAEGVGHAALTMRTARHPPVEAPGAPDVALPSIVLDARPVASGTLDQMGLPVGGVAYGTSTGPGSGGGVGTGEGTGLGSGRGAGVGPGAGGGFGGGAYRPGGAVVSPRLLTQVKPRYTPEALEQKIQGSVWLEVVVTRDGRIGDVCVQRALDPGGLDEQAIAAALQWTFEPGRLAGRPVDVVVTVVMDFSIR